MPRPAEPTPLPCPGRASPQGPRPALVQCFRVEIRLLVHIADNPWPTAPEKVRALRSCTTRRASPRFSDGNSDSLHLGASAKSPWPFGHVPSLYTASDLTLRVLRPRDLRRRVFRG